MWKRTDGAVELQTYLCDIYKPFYDMNDRAHQLPHVISVSELAMDINHGLRIGLDDSILVGAAITHDLFNLSRENHHELAKEYLLTNNIDWLKQFNYGERIQMAHAAGEHRASYKGEYFSVYSEVVASADRGAPRIAAGLIRCAMFGADKSGYRGEELYTHVKSHMKDKFGLNGYARYPELYMKFYEKELGVFRYTMENLTNEIIDYHIGNNVVVSQYFK